jgi:hypothetical protein
MNTEVALLCPSCPEDVNYEKAKAHYVVQSYAASVGSGLKNNLWFTLTGWQNSGLMSKDHSLRPAYTAYLFARNEIGLSQFIKEITVYPGLQGYELSSGDKLIWVIWVKSNRTVKITLPEMPVAIYNSMGYPQIFDGRIATVSGEPSYIEFNP